MSAEIKDLSPKHVWGYFYDLTQIPRPTGHMEAVTRFMISFGKGLGLETLQDEVGNVLIRKPATPGMEGRKTVTLQSHLDMVPQKNSSVKHDFEKDPIDAYIDGDWVTARETTLGADNGMGAALAMAVLADNSLRHGPIEALFTIDEEQGMDGAFGLKPHFLQGDILLNCDSEKEGELFVGCAGGANVNVSFQFKEDTYIPEGDVAVKVSLSGLKGGHSGVDIHCLGVGDFKNRTMIQNVEDLPFVSLNELPDPEYLLRDNDIIFVRSNGNKELVGRCLAIYPGSIPVTYSGFCIRYRLTSTNIDTPYLLQVLKTDSIRKKMTGRGANIQNLNQQTLSQLLVPIPPLSLQNEFAAFVERVDQQKQTIQQSLEKLELMKKVLMQEYFG